MSGSTLSPVPSLRPGREADTAHCVSLWVTACAHRDGQAHSGVAERAEPKFDDPAAWIVAENPLGAIVGFALATKSLLGDSTDPPAAAGVGLLAVDPNFQGDGLGRILLSTIVGELAALGYTQAVLHVLVENRTAVRLYESAGWMPVGAPLLHSLLKRPFQTYLLDLV